MGACDVIIAHIYGVLSQAAKRKSTKITLIPTLTTFSLKKAFVSGKEKVDYKRLKSKH